MLVPLVAVRNQKEIICEAEDYEFILGQSKSEILERYSSKNDHMCTSVKHE